ncbi:hypothetical protein C1H46_045463 [Malus baccata]|uniref:Uncharacterized protein n=1 Tax=Malus baccata TaxID=106549 RepID=A0A540K454_MALBA|nr:hypothetical protein C1H46_045463 [Malus baccata]
MPHLFDPKVLAIIQCAVSDVSQTSSILKTQDNRLDHELVDTSLLATGPSLSTPPSRITLIPTIVEAQNQIKSHPPKTLTPCKLMKLQEPRFHRGTPRLSPPWICRWLER